MVKGDWNISVWSLTLIRTRNHENVNLNDSVMYVLYNAIPVEMFLVTRFNAFSNFMIMLFCIIMCHLCGRAYEPLWVWTFLSAIDIYVSIVTWRVESTDISRRYNGVCRRITASLIRIILDNKLNLFFDCIMNIYCMTSFYVHSQALPLPFSLFVVFCMCVG